MGKRIAEGKQGRRLLNATWIMKHEKDCFWGGERGRKKEKKSRETKGKRKRIDEEKKWRLYIYFLIYNKIFQGKEKKMIFVPSLNFTWLVGSCKITKRRRKKKGKRLWREKRLIDFSFEFWKLSSESPLGWNEEGIKRKKAMKFNLERFSLDSYRLSRFSIGFNRNLLSNIAGMYSSLFLVFSFVQLSLYEKK